MQSDIFMKIIKRAWRDSFHALTLLASGNDTSLLATVAKNANDDVSLRIRWRLAIRIARELYLEINV